MTFRIHNAHIKNSESNIRKWSIITVTLNKYFKIIFLCFSIPDSIFISPNALCEIW